MYTSITTLPVISNAPITTGLFAPHNDDRLAASITNLHPSRQMMLWITDGEPNINGFTAIIKAGDSFVVPTHLSTSKMFAAFIGLTKTNNGLLSFTETIN